MDHRSHRELNVPERDVETPPNRPWTLADPRLGALAAAGGAVLFGTSYVATAFALRSFTPLSAALWRGAGGALVMLAFLALRSRDAPAFPRGAGALARLVLLGLLGGAVFIVSMNVAVGSSGAAIASFVAGLYAVLAALLAPFILGERLRVPAVAGFAVCFAGTYLLTGRGPAVVSGEGIVAGLAAAVSFALYLVLSRRWSVPWGLRPQIVTLSALVSTAVALLVIELVHEPAAIVPGAVRLDAIAAIAWLAVMAGVVAALLVLVAVRSIRAERSAAFLLLNPPSATVLAWLLLGESLSPVQLLGAALVLAGIALATAPAPSFRRGSRVPAH